MKKSLDSCPVCGTKLKNDVVLESFPCQVKCSICGNYRLLKDAVDMLLHGLEDLDVDQSYLPAIIRYAIFKMRRSSNYNHDEQHALGVSEEHLGAPAWVLYGPILTAELIKNIAKNGHFQDLNEQIDNLLLYLGERYYLPGQRIGFSWNEFIAPSGAYDHANESFLLSTMNEHGLLEWNRVAQGGQIIITYEGWQRIEELKLGSTNNRRAFMAMPFGYELLDRVLRDVFKPAVHEAGFELYRLDDGPKAGLIDDRLRVEISTSRFLIAEMTYGNQGAYWEAGYAEGMGKPVIYTCEQKYFDEKKTHFDTNHHLTIRWSEAALEQAANELKATIRATLPGEAKMIDD